jgi:hypothetical protein
MTIHCRINGPENPSTLGATGNLTEVLSDEARYAGAEKLERRRWTSSAVCSVPLHPAIVHIMFGMTDAEDMSPTTTQFYRPGLLADAQQMVAEAKAANIGVVFGLEPNALPQYKELITQYGAAHNIPVINYGDALSGRSQFNATGLTVETGNYSDVINEYNGYLIPNPNDVSPMATSAGCALMTQMAAAVINTMNQWLCLMETNGITEAPRPPGPLCDLQVAHLPTGEFCSSLRVLGRFRSKDASSKNKPGEIRSVLLLFADKTRLR